MKALELGKYDGTFQKSRMLPFHRWYPFTEGFGEKLVCEVIKEFADKSTYLSDPFGGCGTTLLVASKYKLPSGYSEINPFLKFVIETKINSSLRLSENRVNTTAEIRNFLNFIDVEVQNISPAWISPMFEGKAYFDDGTLDVLLRLKNLVHKYSEHDEDLKNLGLLALASILVDVSNLKRAGDLRYRRDKEKRKNTPNGVISMYKQKVAWIIEDFEEQDKPQVLTDFLGENALIAKPNRYADLIVTSPPYLNGTNYVRNTKLELWFLDFVKSKNDLLELHHKLLSSGINHVARGKEILELPTPIMNIVCDLKRFAYDPRIPVMVHQYFSGMRRFFENLYTYTLPSGLLFLDIGDSTFCGVHIPTHDFFKLLAEDSGFHLEDSYLMRTRRSRGNDKADQYLLQFEKLPASRIVKSVGESYDQNTKELKAKFQNSLPYKISPFNKRNWGHKYHSLCSYQSKLKPAIAHFLIKWFTNPSDVVLDPFGGVGTVPLEAKMLGRPSAMIDLSPAAYIVAKAKIEKVKEKEIKDSFNSLIKFINENRNSFEVKEYIDKYADFGLNKKLRDYYHIETFKEILGARRWLKMRVKEVVSQISVADAFVTGCLLHILHGNRPYSVSRRSHPVTPFAPSGPFEYRPIENKLWEKITRTYDKFVFQNDVFGKAYYGDARELSNIIDLKVNAIITSPPFIHSTRFHTNNWIRNWFCGWEPQDFKSLKKDFVEVLQEKNLDVYTQLLEDWSNLLKGNGLVIFHLGTTKDCDMIEEVASRIPSSYKILGEAYEFVRDTETHGVTAQGKTVRHGFLFLKRDKD